MTAKKRLMIFGILQTISTSLILTAHLYATPQFGENCISAGYHTEGGIKVTSNSMDTLEKN